METFTYLAGFATLILGLAVARLLQGLADLTEERARIDFDWIPVWWNVALIGYCAVLWWFILRWRDFDGWTFWHFNFLLAQPSILFYLASLIVPRYDVQGPIDLGAHFEKIRPYFFALIAAYLLLDLVDTALKGSAHFRSLGPLYVPMIIGQAAFFLSGAFVRRRAWQIVLAVCALAGLVTAQVTGALVL